MYYLKRISHATAATTTTIMEDRLRWRACQRSCCELHYMNIYLYAVAVAAAFVFMPRPSTFNILHYSRTTYYLLLVYVCSVDCMSAAKAIIMYSRKLCFIFCSTAEIVSQSVNRIYNIPIEPGCKFHPLLRLLG